MKKILLVGLNARYTHSNLALYYIASQVKSSSNYKASIYETSINAPYLSIMEQCLDEKPDVIGFSVYIWNSDLVKRLVDDINRIKPSLKIILGGPQITYNHRDWREHEAVLIMGTETSFKAAMLDDFAKNEYSEPVDEFDIIGFPYNQAQIESLKKGYVYYESSRGCPFSCSFCLSSAQKMLSYRSLDKVFDELRFFIKNRVKTVKFIDRTFNSDSSRARKIWTFLINNINETLFHFEIEPSLLQEEDFEILEMVPDGLFQLEVGIQSVNLKTLKEVKRAGSPERILNAVRRLSRLRNIHLHTDIIAGLPYETVESFERTFNRIYMAGADNIQLGFLKVLPGTVMSHKKDEYSIICSKYPPYEIFSNKWMSFDEINFLRNVEKLIGGIHNCGKMKNYVRYLGSRFLSPFEHYRKLVIFAKKTDFDLSTKDFDKIAEFLINYHNIVGDGDLVCDILVYDRLFCSKTLSFPAFFSFKSGSIDKKKFITHIRNQFGEAFSKAIAKKSLPFRLTQKSAAFLGFEKNTVAVFCNGEPCLPPKTGCYTIFFR